MNVHCKLRGPTTPPLTRDTRVRTIDRSLCVVQHGMRYRCVLRELWASASQTIAVTTDRRHFALSPRAAQMLTDFLDRFEREPLVDLGSADIPADARVFFATYLVPHRLFVDEQSVELRPQADGKLLRAEVVSAERVMGATRLFGPLLSGPAAVAAALAAVVWASRWGPTFAQRSSYAANVGLSVAEFFALAALVVAMALFHELGHASACRKYSGFAGPVSLSLFYGIPTLSVDVSTVGRLTRRQRVVVALSGLYFQAIAVVALSVALREWSAIGVFVNLALISIVFNLVPLYRNDGYWALGDWLGCELSLDPARFRDGWVERIYLIWMHAMLLVAVIGVVRLCTAVAPEAADQIARLDGERRTVGYTLLALNVAFAVVFALMLLRDRVAALLSLRKP